MLPLLPKEQNRHIRGFSPDAIEAIEMYEWPGNIREMENKIKRAVIMSEDKFISPLDLALPITQSLNINLRDVRQQAEVKAIKKALSATDNNLSSAAKLLGVTRPTLYDLLKKYSIQTLATDDK